MPRKLLRRRELLRTIGAGAGASALVGEVGAKGEPGNGNGSGASPGGPPGNDCPGCPESTRRLAKYEFDDDTGEFSFEKGACNDALSGIEYENKAGETNEPIRVTFTSLVYVENVVVKYGSNCERASESDAVTFEQDDGKDDDGFEGIITVDDPKGQAISHFSLCAGVCYQADFVFGEPIENLGEELYGRDRIVSFRWGGTSTDETDSSNYSPKGSSDGDVVTTADGVQFDGNEATVSFDVDLNSTDLTVSLAVYTATCPPHFDEDTAYIQDLYASDTATFTSDAVGQSLEVPLPGLDQLDELCNV